MNSMPSPRTARLGRLYALILLAAFTVSSCRHDTPNPDGPNLAWDGPKVYAPPSVPLTVSGLGLNGSVDQLPGPAPVPVTISRVITNTGNQPVPAGYEVNETVELMQFVAIAGSAGFVPNASVPPITDQTVLGTALAPGDSVAVSFSFVVPSCGMYRETLTLDGSGTVTELNEGDNVGTHFFGVASTMAMNITVVPRTFSLWHEPAGGAVGPPPGIVAAPGFPATTATFTITAAAPGTTFHYNYRQAPVTGVHGAVARLTGPAPVLPPAPGVAGPIVITHQVSPVGHNVPSVDILTDLGWERFLPKVTAISSDGCVIRQQTAQIGVAHP